MPAHDENRVETNKGVSPAQVQHYGRNVAGSAVENPLSWTKNYASYAGYSELTHKTFGSGGNALVTQYDYYTTTGSGAVARMVKSMVQPDGSWVIQQYHDTNATSGDRGMLKRIYRPWEDLPATPPASPSTSNTTYEDWTYVADLFGRYTLPASHFVYAPGGTILSTTTWAHNHNVGTLNGHTIAQSTRSDLWGSGSSDYVSTVEKYYRRNASVSYLRGKLASKQFPDGRKDSYAYYNGTWNSCTDSFGGSASGNDRLVLIFHGQTTGGTSVSSWLIPQPDGGTLGWTMDSLHLVAGKSTVTERVVDITRRVVFEGEYVYTSSGTLARIAGTATTYDVNGRTTEEIDVIRSVGVNKLKRSRTYTGSLVASETTADGVVTTYSYDAYRRLETKTTGFGGSSAYPARVEGFQYDGANRVKNYYAYGFGTAVTTINYDSARRVSSRVEPKPVSGRLTTSHSSSTSFNFGFATQYTRGGERVNNTQKSKYRPQRERW